MSFTSKSQSPVYTILVRKVRHAQSQSQVHLVQSMARKGHRFTNLNGFAKERAVSIASAYIPSIAKKFSQNQRSFTMKCRSNQKYYEDNKEKISQQQKKYKDSLSKIDKSRAKVLYYLNSDPDYHLKMKEATKEKYGFRIENGRWI